MASGRANLSPRHGIAMWPPRLALVVVVLMVAAAAAFASPKARLRASRTCPGGTTTVRLTVHEIGGFTAASADLRVGAARLTEPRCAQPPNGVRKAALCSQPDARMVQVGIFGFNDDPLSDGELFRVRLAVPDDARPGRYPISAILRFARSDGSEFEVGPIGTKVRVRRCRQGRVGTRR